MALWERRPPCQQNDRQVQKHYLPGTSCACSNNIEVYEEIVSRTKKILICLVKFQVSEEKRMEYEIF